MRRCSSCWRDSQPYNACKCRRRESQQRLFVILSLPISLSNPRALFLRTYVRGYSAENVAIEPPESVLHRSISSITVNCPILCLACFSQGSAYTQPWSQSCSPRYSDLKRGPGPQTREAVVGMRSSICQSIRPPVPIL
jgi:hypothetical protein